ncbi:MAG: TIGR00341 family protein [Parvibaculaceae bacterium]
MPKRQIEIAAPAGYMATLAAIGEQYESEDVYSETGEDERCLVRIICDTGKVQEIIDATHRAMERGTHWRLIILPVEAVVAPDSPEPEPVPEEPRFSFRGRTAAREEILQEVEKGAELDTDFVVLIALSAIVAAVGLISDNLAALIGAMVIAPLLGPNLAFAFGVALGNPDMMRRAMTTNIAGLGFALFFSMLLGAALGGSFQSQEIVSRTFADYDSIALALAAGAAAVLSLTTGLPSALVGVMVAVALLPPAVVTGLMVGSGNMAAAGGAGLLLAVNIVCINLAAQVVFVAKGILPRTWSEKQASRKAVATNLAGWVFLLSGLGVAIYLAQYRV